MGFPSRIQFGRLFSGLSLANRVDEIEVVIDLREFLRPYADGSLISGRLECRGKPL